MRIQILARRESNRIWEVVWHCWEIHSLKKEKSHFLYAFLALLKRLFLPILRMVLEPTVPSASFTKTNPANPSTSWKNSWDCKSASLARARLGGDPGVLLLLLPLITPNDTGTSDGLLLSTAPSFHFMRKEYQSTRLRDKVQEAQKGCAGSLQAELGTESLSKQKSHPSRSATLLWMIIPFL